MKNKNNYSKILPEIARQFSLGEIKEFKLLEDGLVNLSFSVGAEEGKFILQRLNPIWDKRVIEDYCAVERYLRTNGLHVPVLLNSRTNGSYYELNGHIWRAFEYISHDPVQEPTPELAYEAGKTLGKFHRLMGESNFKPTFKLPGFHDTPKILNKLGEAFANPKNRVKSGQATEEFEFIRNNMKKHRLPEYGPKIIIHGDPKLSNFLFKDGRATSLLDLDTMMEASPLIDLGDALRSWCRKKPSTSEYMPEIFEAAMKGYDEESNIHYCYQGVMSAMGLLTLELAARYLADYFEENYFAFKSKKYKTRAEQNLARTRRYLEYYGDFIGNFRKFHIEPYQPGN